MRFNIQECEANMHYRYLNLIYIGVLNLILYVYILNIKIDKADYVKTQSVFISSNLVKCLKLK